MFQTVTLVIKFFLSKSSLTYLVQKSMSCDIYCYWLSTRDYDLDHGLLLSSRSPEKVITIIIHRFGTKLHFCGFSSISSE